jgi:NAD(P)H-dependent flavin oxidoreductase YrpB (nitropropane dioxygenase family)
MVGHPKHIAKALAVGVDIICAQAGEGGGHTGDIPFSVSIVGTTASLPSSFFGVVSLPRLLPC